MGQTCTVFENVKCVDLPKTDDIEEPYSMNNSNKKIYQDLQVTDINENDILDAKTYQLTKSSSIFDIIYNAYCDHNDIILTKDGVLSQFFAILEQCEKNKIFENQESKTDIIIDVGTVMGSKQLRNLPNNFIRNIDIGVFGENLKNKKKLFLEVMQNCSLGTLIFGMASVGKRYNYIAYTRCKVPEITFSASQEEMDKILSILLEFKNVIPSKSKKRSELLECYKALLSYLTFLEKVFNAQFFNEKDEQYFHNLVQRNNMSGYQVKGTIRDMVDCPSESQVYVKRYVRGRILTQYPDLVYSSKLVSSKQGNNLIFDVVSCIPEKDTVTSYHIKDELLEEDRR
jgi:hypothetical protein